jgi:hypothetical protein
VLKAAGLMAFGTAVCLFNLVIAWAGLISGSVKSFRRRSDDLIRLDKDPDWFVLNISFRLIMAISFAAAVVFLWRKLKAERANAVAD